MLKNDLETIAELLLRFVFHIKNRPLQLLIVLPALRFTQIFRRNANVERGVGHSPARTPSPSLCELLVERAFERLSDVLAQDGEELLREHRAGRSAAAHGASIAASHLESVRRTSASHEQTRCRVLGDDEMSVGRFGVPTEPLKAKWALSEGRDALGEESTDEGLRFGGDAVGGMLGLGARVGESGRDVVSVLLWKREVSCCRES
jgi:hypothetical protein